MGAETKIEWTDKTFNPWIGCFKVSPGCKNCYAAALDKRWGHARWGKGAPRERTSEANWKKPIQWDRAAHEAGVRFRVFCASLADVFDDEVPDAWRFDLFEMICVTQHLDWQVLTKRPENARRFLSDPETKRELEFRAATRLAVPLSEIKWPLPNVWLGTTVEDQERADERIPVLLDTPARVHFLSCEPLLEAVDLGEYLKGDRWFASEHPMGKPVDWVIVGGESGAGARPFDLAWAQSIRQQCAETQTPCFVKQLGKVPVVAEAAWRDGYGATPGKVRLLNASNRNNAPAGTVPLAFGDRAKAGAIEEWPDDLRVRQFPEVRRG
jgi:protein gp37